MNEQNKNLITEAYHSLGPWTLEKCLDKLSKTILSGPLKASKLTKLLDNQIIDKSLFSFSAIVSEKPEIEIVEGKKQIKFTYNYKLSGDEYQKFLYGNDDLGGILYNSSFGNALKEAGIAEESVNYDSLNVFQKAYNSIITEASNSIELKLIITLAIKTYCENGNNKKNPNYVKTMAGSLFLGFGQFKPIAIGTVSYTPKRTADMDPKPSLLSGMKELWNAKPDPNTGRPVNDFGVAGLIAKNAMKRIGTSLFGKTIQKEDFEISINESYDKDNIEKITDQSLLGVITKYFKNGLSSKYSIDVDEIDEDEQIYSITISNDSYSASVKIKVE